MDNFERTSNLNWKIQNIKIIANLIVTGVGIAIILVGLKYSIDIFSLVFNSLKDPTALPAVIGQWSKTAGWESLSVTIGGQTYHISNTLSLIVLGIGAMILIKLALSMMYTGSKIVSWSVNEQEAIKRILNYVFGDINRFPKEKNSKNSNKSDKKSPKNSDNNNKE